MFLLDTADIVEYLEGVKENLMAFTRADREVDDFLFGGNEPDKEVEVKWRGWTILFAWKEARVLSSPTGEGSTPDCYTVWSLARNDQRIGRLAEMAEPLPARQGEAARFSITRNT